ncbi:MAG: IPT/TIG domain-containing protein [Cyanobacteria bacterium SZAS LIN-5]|nr:IPT/TIG domain-containing protein [Cyanobacteria bacterium SZAS LIN-5]
MTKPALAAVVALALSIPLANLAVLAQGSSAETKNESKSPVPTTFSAPQQANRARPAHPGTAPSNWSTTQGTAGTRGATQTASSTAAASSQTADAAATTTAPTTTTKTDDSVVVTSSSPRVASGTGNKPSWQKFYDYIRVKSGQDTLPLTLTVTNGNANHPAFEAVRLFLAGQQLATEKDFKNGVLQLKMDGTLSANGDNQLLIQGYGVPAAAISWKLTTQRAVLTAVTPDTAAPGDSIKITGRNFSNKTGVSQVWVGDKLATITSGNAKTLIATVPQNAVAGENKLNVAVGGIAAKPLKITIKGNAPELTATDLYGAPPGYAVTVTGKGFAPNAADNVVSVGGVTATITACSTTSITFQMPELPNAWAAVPLVVKTKGVASKNTLQVQPSNRLLPTNYQ